MRPSTETVVSRDNVVVSVIMAAYNAEPYITHAIGSIVAQTYPYWELVIIDDGSTDGTRRIVENFTADARVVYISRQNGGAAAARNTGLHHCSGEFVLFLDADDWLTPDAMAILVGLIEKSSETGAVFGDGFLADASGKPFQSLDDYRILVSNDHLEQFVVSAYIGYLGVVLLRRSALEQLDGPFDEELYAVEDWDLLIRLAETGCTFLHVRSYVGYYRIHSTNTSSPTSSSYQRRQLSLRRARWKVVNAPYFVDLPERIRYQVYYGCFLTYFSNCRDQIALVETPGFRLLPTNQQARILYDAGLQNLIDGGDPALAIDLLSIATQTDPTCKHYLTLRLCRSSNLSRKALLSLRRIWGQMRGRKDAVAIQFPNDSTPKPA